MVDWQPIETAPKDGTWILVWAPANYESDFHAARWMTVGAVSGWFLSQSDDWGPIIVTGEPTHWMSLLGPAS